jgi:peptidoglycan/LPS O-acetylase OafA/YrhL
LRYRAEIDGLRAVAVIPVVLFHAGFGLFSGGFVGVDIFFVISGYLITSIIVREMEGGSFSLLHFYERRARRILPALTFVVGVCIPFAWFLLLPGDMEDFLGSIVAICFFVSNFFFLQESDYFDQGAELEPLIHTWSLSVEEQFYLLFPLFLLLLWKRGKGRVQAGLFAVFVASLALAHWGAYAQPKGTFLLLPMRAWELALGAIVALYLGGQAGSRDLKRPQFFSLVGLALLAFAIFAFDETTPFPSLYALVPTIGAALIIVCATPETLVGAVLGSRALVGIGLISYSAYLWHQPIFAFSRYASIQPLGDGVMLLLSVSAFFLAWFTWRYVEQPFRKPARISLRALVGSAVATGTVLLTFALAGNTTGNFSESRFTVVQQKLLKTASTSPKRKDCHLRREYQAPSEACAYHYPDPDWVVLGNSHAVELAYELAENLRSSGEGVKHLTVSGCDPDIDSKDDADARCTRWTGAAIDYILGESELDHVVLSYRTSDLAPRISGEPEPETVSEQAEIVESYLAIVRRLVEAGKRVYLVLQAPMLERHVGHYVRAIDLDDDLNFVAGVDRQRWDRSIAQLRDRLDELPKGVTVVDPAELFCNKDVCASILRGRALYFDNDHLSLSGADIVADEIMRRASEAPSVARRLGNRGVKPPPLPAASARARRPG